jgi:very-short-patch-repair endonuclease
MGKKVVNPDQVVARIAARQHGVVSAKQLAEAGISYRAASKRVRTGRLHRVHRGVYAVGHRASSWQSRWMAAVLACGEGSVLSHLSAAHLWQLLDPEEGPIEVSTPGPGGRAQRKGIRIHRRPSLRARDKTRRFNIPVTTPAQTIADLRRSIAPTLHHRAIRRAEVLGLRTGLAKREPTRSELEDLFLRLCRRHGLPKPEVNVRVGAYEVDFLWRPQRLIVETDGYKYHRGSQAFEDDHNRALTLRAERFSPLHFTFRQVVDEPDRVAALVARELRRGHVEDLSPPQLPARRA